jgi:hypothetical protein
MGTLEDQLKKWKTTATPTPSSPHEKGASVTAPTSKRAAKKKPLLTTIRRDEPTGTRASSSSSSSAAAPAKALTDAELFAAAVEGVSQDAVLNKFAAAPDVTVRGARLAPSPPKSDEQLFAEFVGGVVHKS